MSSYYFGSASGKYNFTSASVIELEPMQWYCILAISFIVSLWGLTKIWKSPDYLFFKILYSIIIFVPIIGTPIVLWIMHFFIPKKKN